MSVYFVYRSHYDNPGAFHVKVFPQDTVLEWFRSIWRGIPDAGFAPPHPAYDYAEKLLGRRVYSFGGLFTTIHELTAPPPETMADAVGILRGALYQNELRSGKHHVQWLTDDDEIELAAYIFDDHYARRFPHRAAFLMREDWKLPDGAADEPAKRGTAPKAAKLVRGTGATYFVHFEGQDDSALSELSSWAKGRVPNVRVQDFPRYLFALRNRVAANYEDEALSWTLRELLSGLDAVIGQATGDEAAFLAALAANPDDYAGWCAYCDWRMENDKPTLLADVLRLYHADAGAVAQDTREATKDEAVVQTHVAQASKHVARWHDEDLFHHFILFDDLWANAQPDLAASVLRVASRWDPL